MLRGHSNKNIVALGIDAFMYLAVGVLGLYVRLGANIVKENPKYIINQIMIFVLSAVVANCALGVYRDVWRYININYLHRYLKHATLTIFFFVVALFVFGYIERFPRSVLFINWILLVFAGALPKIVYRAYLDSTFRFIFKKSDIVTNPVLVIGLNRTVESFIEEMENLTNAPYEVVGIIDKKQNVGRILNGIPIVGTIENIESVVEGYNKKKSRPTRILVSSEVYLAGQLKRLIKISEKLSIPVSRLPRITELSHNVTNQLPLQPIALEDLLRRSQKILNYAQIDKLINDQKVLITGAGGSIGAEIVKQVAQRKPKEVMLVDFSEFLLYEIEQDCRIKFPGTKIEVQLCDIREANALEKVISKFRPNVVFHAAALKHVPLLETHKIEAIKTNIFGTSNIINSACEHGVERVVFISTDKAVNPKSFMGQTKRVAEMICHSMASQKTKINMVRFGNVLGSNGSVVPLFEKQIANGGPVTVTHPETTRFFMTIPEAVGLVLQAAAFDDSDSKTYVLDMGEPIRILDLAKQMIMLAGLRVNEDIKIEFSGLRPGEKLHEVLVTDYEQLLKTEHKDIFEAPQRNFSIKLLGKYLDELAKACYIYDVGEAEELVKKIIALVKTKE